MLFFEENGCKVLKGDCRSEMKELKEGSVDLVLTDPPYGYSFMGKDWDKAVPKVEVWEECLRVLKPGAFCLVMSAPRQDVLSRMIVNLGDAGFRTDFTSIYWTFASGFPKAASISKLVDKRNGAEREAVGISKRHSGTILNSPFHERGITEEIPMITIPASKEAKALNGSYAGFQPKPAVEVVIVCMKPLSEKSYVDQAMKNGKGIAWFDDCRIPHIKNEPNDRPWITERIKSNSMFLEYGTKRGSFTEGRFSANLLVSDDSLNDGKVRTTGDLTGQLRVENKNVYSTAGNTLGTPKYFKGDSGSYSRYFDLDSWYAQFLIVPKASKSEKNKGCEDFFWLDGKRIRQTFCKTTGRK